MPGIRGDRVRNLRLKSGRTQLELAIDAQMSQGQLSRIERDTIGSVGSEIITGLAKTLNTSTEFLIGLTNDPRPGKLVREGALLPDEEELVRTYRAIDAPEIKHTAMETLRRLLGLDRSLRSQIAENPVKKIAP